jgi:hypothetical protein
MKRILSLIFGLAMVAVLAGCTLGGQETTMPSTATVPPTLEPTFTNAPPPTPIPQIALLLTGDGADPAQLAEAEAALSEVAAGAGLQVVRQATLDPAAAPAGLHLVMAVSPVRDIASLATALPQVQFVALGHLNLTPTPNLTVISGSDADTTLAFTAGYVAAVQSEEWRIGIISTNDTSGQLYRRAFLNGVIYFCGVCTPIFPPFETYPVYVELPAGSSATELEAAAEVMFSKGVNMVHVIPSLQTDAIYQYLAQRGVFIVGTAQPPAGLEGNWVASITPVPEVELVAALQSILETGALGQVGTNLEISYTGASTARVGHFREIIQMLESGFIDPVGVID